MTEFNLHPPITIMPVLFNNVPVRGFPNIQGRQVLLRRRRMRFACPTIMRLVVGLAVLSVAVEELRQSRSLSDERPSSLYPITDPRHGRVSDVHINLSRPSRDSLILNLQLSQRPIGGHRDSRPDIRPRNERPG